MILPITKPRCPQVDLPPTLGQLPHDSGQGGESTKGLTESSLVGFGGLDDNPIKGLTGVLSVEQVLNAKLIGFNTSEQV
jgi:hypothetical protein